MKNMKKIKNQKHHHLVSVVFFHVWCVAIIISSSSSEIKITENVSREAFPSSIKKSTGYFLSHTPSAFSTAHVCVIVHNPCCRKSSKRFVFCVVCVVGYPSKRRKFKKRKMGNSHRRKYTDSQKQEIQRLYTSLKTGFEKRRVCSLRRFYTFQLIEESSHTRSYVLYQICSKSLKNHQHAHVLTSLFLYKFKLIR